MLSTSMETDERAPTTKMIINRLKFISLLSDVKKIAVPYVTVSRRSRSCIYTTLHENIVYSSTNVLSF